MKTIKKLLVLIVLLSISVPQQTVAQHASVSFQVFYDELSPYGTWIDHPGHGYVWMPSGYTGFMPYYSGGYWVYTDFGWTWISDYTWGWAPFHYGRWDYDPFYGWVWLPGPDWGPAWVAWRICDGYYGWAPMGPGVNVNVTFSSHYSPPGGQWVFVPQHHFGKKDMNIYYGPRREDDKLVKISTPVKNTYVDKSRNITYAAGPERGEVQRVTGNKFETYALKESPKPIQKMEGNQIAIYRPVFKNSDDKGNKPVPPNVIKSRDSKPVPNIAKPKEISEEKPLQMERPNRAEDMKPEKKMDLPVVYPDKTSKPEKPITPKPQHQIQPQPQPKPRSVPAPSPQQIKKNNPQQLPVHQQQRKKNPESE